MPGTSCSFLFGRIQHKRQAAEPVDQPVRQRVCVSARMRKIQKKFQRLMLGKVRKTLAEKAAVHPLPVCVMLAHLAVPAFQSHCR